MIHYRELNTDEIDRQLFHAFQRRQVVTDCWRKEDGQWVVKSDPFIDDWGEKEYEILVTCLKNTVAAGGLVYGVFADGELKGFVSVEGAPIGRKLNIFHSASSCKTPPHYA